MISLPQPMFATALKRLFHALDANSELEAHTHIKIDALGDSVRFSAMSSRVSAEAVLPLGTVLSTRLLLGTAGILLKNLVTSFDPSSYVTLEVKGTTLFVKASTSTFRLPVLDPAVIPNAYSYAEMKFAPIDMKALLKGISQVVFCVNKDGTHHYQKGICINKEHFVSTDGFRLACYPNTVVDTHSVMLPHASAASLPKMFASTKYGGIVICDNVVHVYGDGLYASMRTLVEEFPNYKAVLPVAKGMEFEFNRKQFLAPLERLSFLMKGSRGLSPLKMAFDSKAGALYLMAETDMGKGYEVLPCRPNVDCETKLSLTQVMTSIEHFEEDTFVLELFAPPNEGLVLFKSGGALHALSTITG